MSEDTDIRGVQTPDAIPLPDAAVLDGSASLAEFIGLLRDSTLAGSAAASAAQTAAEAVAGTPPAPDTAYSVNRRLKSLSPAQVLEQGGTVYGGIYVSGSPGTDQIVERLTVGWGGGAAGVTGPRLFSTLAVGPSGTTLTDDLGVPSEWVLLEKGLATPDVQGASFTYDCAAGYYVPAGYEVKVIVLPTPEFVSVQYVEMDS